MPRRKRNKKWLKVVMFLILLGVAGVICYLVWDAYFRDTTPSCDDSGDAPAVVAMTDVVEKSAKEPTTEVTEEEKKEASEKMKQYDEPEQKAEEYTGIINYAAVNGGTLVVRVNIDQYAGSGTCELSLKKNGGVVYTATAPVADVVSTATCEGFDVPVSQVGASGEIDIVVTVNADGKSGVISGRATI